MSLGEGDRGKLPELGKVMEGWITGEQKLNGESGRISQTNTQLDTGIDRSGENERDRIEREKELTATHHSPPPPLPPPRRKKCAASTGTDRPINPNQCAMSMAQDMLRVCVWW